VKTLDQAFGVERKGKRIPELRKREILKAQVAFEVDKLHREEKLPIDEALFAGRRESSYQAGDGTRHLLQRQFMAETAASDAA
jgi:hypothetical protein